MKTKKKNKKITDMKNVRPMIIILIISIFLLILLLVMATYFRNYGRIDLTKNKKDIFTISDLIVDDIKYGDSETTIIKSIGYPIKETKNNKNSYKYKKLYYKGLILTLKEQNNEYRLVKAEITSGKYKTSRSMKVNKKITKLFKAYRIDNSKGQYIYGNYSQNSLTSKENKSNIFYGTRSNEEILYVNRDKVIDNLPTNIAKLRIEYKYGRIKKIIWSYDVQ